MAKVLFHLLTNAVQSFHLHLYSFSHLFFFPILLLFLIFSLDLSLSLSFFYLFLSFFLFFSLHLSSFFLIFFSPSHALYSYYSPSLSLSLSLSHVASRASHVPLPTFKTLNSSSFRQTNFSVNFFRSQKNNHHNLCICTHHCHHPYSGHMERGKVS